MKNLLCFIVLIGTCVSAIAQQYQYVPTTAAPAMWQIVNVFTSDDSIKLTRKCTQVNFHFTMSGADTVCYGKTWKKIISRERRHTYTTFLHTPCQLPDVTPKVATSDDYLYSAIREDNKVVDECFFNPIIYFDFNATVGTKPPYSYMGTVNAIDTIVVDGGLRRRFLTSSQSGGQMVADTIIEGIGSIIRGLAPTLVGYNAKLTCFESNGKIIYQNLDYPCGVLYPKGTPTGVSNISETGNVRIYPNPFTDRIQVSHTPPGSVASLYSSLGQRIADTGPGTDIIETPALPAGVYFLLIKDINGNTIHTQRLLKE